MATESGKTDETMSIKPVETGDNKMASSTIKATEHELKIMEVEGAKDQASMDTIELDDEDHNDIDNVPLETAIDTSDRQQDDESLQEDEKIVEDEKMSTKSEPSSGGETNASYNHDPMDLLERIETNHEESGDDEEDELTSGDEGSGDSGNGKRTRNPAKRWQAWMKRWPWLLHEESDGDCAFCLYCNVVININRRVKFIQQHNLSLYHQERETNYMAFKNRVRQKVRKEHVVKHEFGTNEYVAAIKQQRKSEVENFNNFNWERWLKSHSWLERTQSTGTIGLCKVCNVRMNVEFVYLRRRHETSKGHCEAERQLEKQSLKRKRSVSPEEKLDERASKKSMDDSHITTVGDGASDTEDPSLWFERVPDTNPPQCRCTLCDCRMAITSFLRHSRTNVHCSNLSSHQKKQLLTMDRGIWSQYAELHPWLVADPDDPMMAFCSVCSKRFNYGHSEIKRKNHENSERHKALMEAAAATAGDEEKEEEKEEEQVEEEAEEEESEAEEQSETISNAEGSDEEENSEEYKVTKRQKNKKSKQIMVRHYAWLRYSRDRKLQMCKYCRVRFHNEASKQRHEMSEHHKKMAKSYKAQRATTLQQRKQKDLEEEEEMRTVVKHSSKPVSEEPIPATVQGRVMVWKNRFPWLSYKRSEERLNYAWCKLCEVSIYMPSSKFASKHQRSSRHVRRHFDRKRGVMQPAKEETSMLTGEAKQKAAMSELQAKYSWLEPDASDENYCHCKICDARLPIKVFYLRQHDGSRKHNEQVELLRNASEAATIVVADPQPTPSSVVQVEQEGDSDEALSVKSECSTEELMHARRSRRSLEVRRILKALRDSVGGSRRHEERSQLDMAKDMICSSFDIVQRLRNLERDNGTHEYPATPVEQQQQRQVQTTLPPAPPAAPQVRDTIDLFFESITQTMKTLPVDLVAEGKAKIMQIVCNLELRGMQRTQATQEVSPLKETPLQAEPERLTIDESLDVPPESPESRSSSVIFDDEQPVEFNSTHDNIDPSARVPSTPTTTTRATLTTTQNGIAKEVLNVKRLLPNSTSSNMEAGEPLRLVPINKLTSGNPSQNQNNNIRFSGINQALRKNQQQQQSQQQTPVKVPTGNGFVKVKTNASGAENPTLFIRKVHVSNGSKGISKVITYQQQAQRQEQQQEQQQKLPLRYMSVSSASSTPTQPIYTEATTQFRALNTSCTVVRPGSSALSSNRSFSHT